MSPPKTLKSLMKEALPAKTETPSIAKKDKIKTVPKNESLTTEKKEVSKPITLETVVKEPTATAKELKIRGGLNQDFTLENFIQSEHSEFALQCMDALIKYEFQRPRQLLIYGEPGLGKTHLLTALGWSLKKHHKVVKLVTGEDFINDFHAHINKKIMGDFRNKYRLKTDVLLIDDIHAIAKNKNAQEELFNLFNFYEQRHKILVFTSDLSIDELVDFEPRMISRFQGGLAAEVHKPDLETRLKILKSKNAKSGFEIDPSILLLIAQNVTQNIRSLEGALYKIGLFKKLKKNPLTADDLEKILHIKNMQKQTLSVEDILEDCAKNAGLKVYELKSQSRKHEIVKARNRAMLRMREELNLPFTEIGRILTKNHSTVMSGIANAKAYEEPISL
jgi:chromosomal replication initiator protein